MDTGLRTYVIANPASRNGDAGFSVAWLKNKLAEGAYPNCTLLETLPQLRGTDLAACAIQKGAEVIIAMGGDGVIHECLQALMALPPEKRPLFGVLPAGNGNDFARTLRMPCEDIEAAWEALLAAKPKPCDIGEVNGEYFAQTMSFGLDAAIAIGTHERRERTGKKGTRLFIEEGIHQLTHHRDVYKVKIELDGKECHEHEVHLLAIQNGPTYGGGFKVAPYASVEDGTLELCAALAPMGFFHALAAFMSCKEGQHLRRKDFVFYRAQEIKISYEKTPPTQVDGEQFEGQALTVRCHPAALQVLFGPEKQK